MAEQRKKVISIGGDYGDVDVTRVQAIVDHPDFQRLRFLGQITPLNMVFPGATHTRFIHALRVYNQVLQSGRYIADKTLSVEDLAHLAIYGLAHDIYHGPFSHLLEPLYASDHDTYAISAISRIKDALQKSGADFDAMRRLFSHEDKHYLIVHDKNVGLEKLDYLYWDTFYCGYGGRPEVNALYDYIQFLPDLGEMAISIARLEELKAFQETYARSYKNIYFRKQSVILTRLFQKLGSMVLDTGVLTNVLRHWTDDEFLGYCAFSKNPFVKDLYNAFVERRLPKVALSIRPPGDAAHESARGKMLSVQTADKALLTKFCAWDITRISATERQIAAIVGLLPQQILLVTQMRPDRFVTKDITITDGDKHRRLSEMCPRHFENLREISESTLYVRVAVSGNEADRARIFRAAAEITKYLLENT